MNASKKTVVLALTSGMFLSACTAGGPIYSTFTSEAGALNSNEQFGSATAVNHDIMTRKVDYTVDLSRKFESEVPTTVNFEFNSAELDAASRQILRRQAEWIARFPEISFKVVGHADRVGLNRVNVVIGKQRADAVVDYLVANGVERSRLEAVVSRGESEPVVETPDRERLNRRAVTTVSGFVLGSPQETDGLYVEAVYLQYIESSAVPTTLETDTGAVTATAGEQ